MLQLASSATGQGHPVANGWHRPRLAVAVLSSKKCQAPSQQLVRDHGYVVKQHAPLGIYIGWRGFLTEAGAAYQAQLLLLASGWFGGL